jgi:hypothetical protein
MAAFLRLVSKGDRARIHYLNLELVQRVEDRSADGKRSLQLTMSSGERIVVEGKYAATVMNWMKAQSISSHERAAR